jgi:hypothetical protein
VSLVLHSDVLSLTSNPGLCPPPSQRTYWAVIYSPKRDRSLPRLAPIKENMSQGLSRLKRFSNRKYGTVHCTNMKLKHTVCSITAACTVCNASIFIYSTWCMWTSTVYSMYLTPCTWPLCKLFCRTIHAFPSSFCDLLRSYWQNYRETEVGFIAPLLCTGASFVQYVHSFRACIFALSHAPWSLLWYQAGTRRI